MSFGIEKKVMVWCAWSLLALAGCGGGNDTSPSSPPPASVSSATIGAGGGTVNGPDGVQLVIPPGALSADVTISLARSSAGAPVLPADVSPSLPVYEITPHGLQFAQPVQVKIPTGSSAAAGVFAWVANANPGEPWRALPAKIENGFLVVERLSLSWYGDGNAILACAPQLNDPYPCRRVGMGVADSQRPVVADPLSALTVNPIPQVSPTTGVTSIWRRTDITQNAQLSMPLNFSGPPDCFGGELEVYRQLTPAGQLSQPAQRMSTQSITLAAPAPNTPAAIVGVWVGSHTFIDSVDASHNGRINYTFYFNCRRSFDGALRYASGFLDTMFVNISPNATAPVFSLPPVNAQVISGQPANFTATAQGTPAPAIRWQVAPASGLFADVTGEANCTPTAAPASGTQTTAACTIANTPLGNSGQRYRAVASNIAAPGGVSSTEATLTISPVPAAPVITQGPAAQTITESGSASFSVTASGTGTLTYRWQINGNDLPVATGPFAIGACTGNAVYSQAGAVLTLFNVSAGCNGASVAVVVSNGVTPNATSVPVSLTVNPPATGWVRQTSGVNNLLHSIDTWDGNIAWAVGAGGWITRTTNGGANWTAQQIPNVAELWSVSSAAPSVVWAVGGETILESRDGGVTWAAKSGAAGEYLYSVSAVDSVTAYAVGFNGVILRNNRGGRYGDWETLVPGTGPANTLTSVSQSNEQEVWASGNQRILKTVDGGENWVQLTPAGVVNYGGMVVAYSNGTTAFVTAQGGVLRTLDGGTTWTLAALPGNVTPHVLKFSGNPIPGNTTLWAFTQGLAATAYRSTDGGVTWTVETPIAPSNVHMRGFTAIAPPSQMWGVGDGGIIVKQ